MINQAASWVVNYRRITANSDLYKYKYTLQHASVVSEN